MLTGMPLYVTITFLVTVLLTFLLFIDAVKNKALAATIIIIWLGLQGSLAYKGFYQDETTTPPRFMLAVVPSLIFIIVLLIIKQGQGFKNGLDLKKLTLLHIVRVPVELVLYWLAANETVPELMTFAGRNFDVLSGITAPIMYIVCFKGKEVRNKNLLLVWNFVCLALLVNIVVNAVLSVPTRIQQFAFDQPNIALLYFPFIWLPCFIVMVVLLSHLVAIGRLIKK